MSAPDEIDAGNNSSEVDVFLNNTYAISSVAVQLLCALIAGRVFQQN